MKDPMDSKDSMNGYIRMLQQKLQEKDRTINQLMSEIEALQKRVYTDDMTGLLNREAFKDRVRQMLLETTRNGGHTFVVFLDVDNFKGINDAHGHDGGDFALISIATRLGNAMRRTDVIGRWSGDEFVAAFHMTPEEFATQDHRIVFERMQKSISKPTSFKGKEMNLTCSMGAVTYSGNEEIDPEVLINQADEAMYASKRAGKDRISVAVYRD